MNSIARKPNAPSPLRISDHEFLPAALEILETPPSPIRLSLLIVICAFTTITLIWSYVGRIDIIAVAQGKFQPTGRVKIIQPLEAGKVLVAYVENGRHVQQGETLVQLDPSESAADEAQSAAGLASYSAEALRRQASLEGAAAKTKTIPQIVWPDFIPDPIRRREERVMTADLETLNAQVASLAAQAEQKRAERGRLAATIAAQNDLIATLNDRVDMRKTLVEKNAGSKASLIDAIETLQYQRTVLAQQTGQLAEAEANLAVISRDIEKSYETFISDNAQKLAEAERQVDDLTQKLAKARAKSSHMVLKSPIAGTVQSSSITTEGQVVTSGEEIMRISPQDAVLEIECYLPNKDIGFVQEGQEAAIKIEAFPFTRFGTIKAYVTRVGRDAIPEPDADRTESNASKPSKSTTEAGAQRTQNLVFPVTLRPERATMDVDGTDVPLTPGMAASVEIRTGSRRMLEYIFSPIVQTASEAMKER